MPNTINADNGVLSGITGIRTTADNTGNLALQSNGVTLVTLSSNNTVTFANTATVVQTGNAAFSANVSVVGSLNSINTFGYKNRIINGNMTIDQRNNAANVTITTNPQYTLDRWYITDTVASKLSVQQNAGSVTPPAGFSKYLGATSLSAYSIGASELFLLRQGIEGNNISDLGWGTANAKTVTLSFWVRSSLTGTFSGTLRNAAASRFYQFSYTINAANTWEYETITIAGDTTGTWATDNTVGIDLMFSLGTGSTFQGAAGSWGSTAYYGVTGTTSVVGTNGATFYITGVQFEVGSQATSFDFRSYGTELALCYRYFRKYPPYSGSFLALGVGMAKTSSTMSRWGFTLDIPMRVAPSATCANCVSWSGDAGGAISSISSTFSTVNAVDMDLTTSGLSTSGNGVLAKVLLTSDTGSFTLGAEL